MDPTEMTTRLIRAIEHPAVNVIGHPTARSIGHRPPIEFDARAVFQAAARAGTALEINSFPDRLDLNDELARAAQDLGVVFSIATDAHSVRHLDNIRYGVATAQRGMDLTGSRDQYLVLAQAPRFSVERPTATVPSGRSKVGASGTRVIARHVGM